MLSGNRRAAKPDPAPGDLGVVQAFLNTENLRSGSDRLQSRRGLADWLASVRLLTADAEVGSMDSEAARELRLSLRQLCAAHTGSARPGKAGEVLDQAARNGRLALRFNAEGVPYVMAEAGGVAGALAQILAMVIRAREEGVWRRLKVCADPKCAAAFYDHSRNHAAKWCTPKCCDRATSARPKR